MVVGEREIITQVRKSYDVCKNEGLCGDLIRLVIKSTINTAKQVYTDTKIALNPVSIVSLAERELRARKLSRNSRIVMIGAGETNLNMSKYLVKQGYSNFAIFNRSKENAVKLASMLSTDKIEARPYTLNDLSVYDKGFDVLIVCTSSPEQFISRQIYSTLLNGEVNSPKVIIDLSIPSNISPEVFTHNHIDLIDISRLRNIAEKNMAERQKEFLAAEEVIVENISLFHQLNKTRKLELKMRDVPQKIRQIKDQAVNDIFADDISTMDENSREILSLVYSTIWRKNVFLFLW
jgi:glutamyl-tRNA reductase